jgi:hypothetical protein
MFALPKPINRVAPIKPIDVTKRKAFISVLLNMDQNPA